MCIVSVCTYFNSTLNCRDKNILSDVELNALGDIMKQIVDKQLPKIKSLPEMFKSRFPNRQLGYPTYKVLNKRLEERLPDVRSISLH
jgi:hypothetical protein